MFKPVKLLDLELSAPPRTIGGLDGYRFLQLLVRLHGTPLGYIKVPIIDGCCAAEAIGEALLFQQQKMVIRHLLLMRFSRGVTDFNDLIKLPPPDFADSSLPLVTVAVCTRDCQDADLKLCLDSLHRLDYPQLDILIVDNAPCTLGIKELVTEHYPQMRYICEERPGLNWARNRAILEARGDIVAFTDDDVVVDPGWVKALAAVFGEEPETMAVTGSVLPYELEAEAQELFEMHGGFCKGFFRRWYCAKNERVGFTHGATGMYGTGANMAYRRSLFDLIGYFDPALDVGTVTNGGGDLEMLFRVIKKGYMLVYEPKALVRHRHRRDYPALRRQIANWGIGFSAYLMHNFVKYRDERAPLARLYFWWLKEKIRCVLASLMYPHPRRDLHFQEFKGLFKGPFRYFRARWQANKIIKTYGPPAYLEAGPGSRPPASTSGPKGGTAVRTVDIAQPLPVLHDVMDYAKVRVFARRGDIPVGLMNIPTLGQPLRNTRLREALVDHFKTRLFYSDNNSQFDDPKGETFDIVKAEAYIALERHLLQADTGSRMANSVGLPDEVSVSIILATCDRPDDLRPCLNALMAQKSTRKIEIIVVDNHPASGLTPPVVADFPNLIFLDEPRRGASYARNTGIAASTGDIIVTIDDDEIAPPGWLEKLLAPFRRSDVMVVTGNVLPLELETRAQLLFETYGGLERGSKPINVGKKWFETSAKQAVPTWQLGGTGNAAFRAGIFADPQIGRFDESLGPPFGVGEDAYLFYKVLKAGHTILYEPKAYLFHKHRRSLKALQRQIYNYSKGHVAYHLTTLCNDHDFRSLLRLFIELPGYHLNRLIGWLLGRQDYPLSLIMREIGGNVAGPYAFFKSRRRVKRLGAKSEGLA